MFNPENRSSVGSSNSKVMVVALLLAFVSASQAATSRIGILVFDGVLTSDVTAPVEVFGAAGKQKWFSDYEVILIAVGSTKQVTTEEGLKIVADVTLADNIRPDILIVPGAYDVRPLVNNKALIQYIRQIATKARWLASNCAGAFILGEAGVLNNREATTWRGGETDLQQKYRQAKVRFNRNVVISGNLVTSQGGMVSYEAAMSLLELLSSSEHASAVAKQINFSSAPAPLACGNTNIPAKHEKMGRFFQRSLLSLDDLPAQER